MTGTWRVLQRFTIVRTLMTGASAVIMISVRASATVYGYPFSAATRLAAAPDGRCSGASIRVEMTPTTSGTIAAAASIARRIQVRSTQAGGGTNDSENVANDGKMMPSTATIQTIDPKAITER